MKKNQPFYKYRFAYSAAMCAALAAGASVNDANAEAFTLSTPTGTGSVAVGQSFIPGFDESPDTGLGAGDSVYLENYSFVSGGTGVGSSATRLAVFNTPFFGFTVTGPQNPDFTFPIEANLSDAVALSENTVDAAAAGEGDALSFDFDSLELDAGVAYSAILVAEAPGDKIVPTATSLAFVEFVEVTTGVFQPAANLGGTGNFNFTSLFADTGGFGFLGGATDANDLAFTATFNTEIPEPGSLTLAVLAGALIMVRRKSGKMD